MRKLCFIATTTFLFTACPRAGAADAGANPVLRTLTEKDTVVPALDGGRVTGTRTNWTIALTPDWLQITDEKRTTLKPDLEAWFLEPTSKAQATVACGPQFLGGAALVEERARAVGLTAKVLSNRPLDGPWLEGTQVVFETSGKADAQRHVLGLYVLGRTGCEVQAWAPAADPAGSARLEALVQSFRTTDQRAMKVLARVARAYRNMSELEEQKRALIDAGVPPSGLAAALSAQGLPRLSESLLVERFTLRLTLINRLDEEACGAVVSQDAQADVTSWLEQLTEGEAERWAEISEATLRAAALPAPLEIGGPRLEVLEAQVAAREEAFARALRTLKTQGASPRELCLAERNRLAVALRQAPELRLQLLRSWAR